MTMVENKQVTNNSFNNKSNLVGTSETLRSVPLNISDDRFDQWLSGFIDGRGNLLVNKSGNCSFELVVDKYDSLVLLAIKNKLGGSIKSRVNSYRYLLRYDKQLINLLNRINGNIRSSQRIPQFRQMCTHYRIIYRESIPLTSDNAWYSGYFDALGTINCDRMTIEMTVSTKHEVDIKLFNTGPFSHGQYTYVKACYGYYTWSTTDKSTIMDIYHYFKLYPSRTHMLHRIKLIKEFYTLQSDQSLYNQTTKDKLWNTFLTKWEDRVKIKSVHIKLNELTNVDLVNMKNDKS